MIGSVPSLMRIHIEVRGGFEHLHPSGVKDDRPCGYTLTIPGEQYVDDFAMSKEQIEALGREAIGLAERGNLMTAFTRPHFGVEASGETVGGSVFN